MDVKTRIGLLVEARGTKRAASGVTEVSTATGRLTTQTDKATLATGRAEKANKRHLNVLRSLGPTMAAGAVAAVGLGVALAKGAVDEYREAYKVGRQTNTVIRTTGAAAWTSADHIGDLATALSDKAAIDDEAIQSSANLLLTFKKVRNEAGKGSDVFDRATAAAVDLSAAGFGSIDSAAKQMGKALNDPVKGISALSRSGVTFTKSQQKQIKHLVATNQTLEAQKMILGEVESQVKGSAAAQADPLAKLNVAWGNLLEQLGGYLVPIINKAAAGLTTFIKGIQEGSGAGGKFSAAMKSFGAAAGPVISKVIELGKGLLNALKPMAPFLTKVLLPIVRAAFTGMAAVIQKVGLPAIRLISRAYGAIGNALGPAVTWIMDKLNGLVSFMSKLPGRIAKVAGNLWSGMKSGLVSVINWSIDRINDLIGAYNAIPLAPNIDKVGHVGGGDSTDGAAGGGFGGGVDSALQDALRSASPRAAGGPIQASSPYLVGEQGPELVVPSHDGTVIPNGALGRDLVINVPVDVGGKTVARVVRRVAMADLLAQSPV